MKRECTGFFSFIFRSKTEFPAVIFTCSYKNYRRSNGWSADQRKTNGINKAPTLPSLAAGSLELCINVDCDAGLEVDGEVILEDRDLGDQALDQHLVKLYDGGGLAFDEILQVLDQAHLLVLDHTVHLGLLSHIPETENLVNDGVVVSLLVGLLHKLLLQLPEALVDDLRG